MKKILGISAVLIMVTLSGTMAQQNATYNSSNYSTAIGIKFYPTGVTLKHFISADKRAVEFIGFFYNEGARVTGLYEFHYDIPELAGLKWYVGPGVHLALYNNKHDGFTSVGVDGVIGLDYKINNAPINLSLDYQPSLQVTDFYGDRFVSWGGLGIRYTF